MATYKASARIQSSTNDGVVVTGSDGASYDVIRCNGNGGGVVVYDTEHRAALIGTRSVFINGGGYGAYAHDRDVKYVHHAIAEAALPAYNDAARARNTSIDHINGIKTDNRAANLRVASQAEQNSNRGSRADKHGANDELVALGITELPRYIREDRREGKFTFVDHPMAANFNANSTKSAKASSPQKLLDVCRKLERFLVNVVGAAPDAQFQDMRTTLAEEYNRIVGAAHAFDPALIPAQPLHTVNYDVLTHVRSVIVRLEAALGQAAADIPRGSEDAVRTVVKLASVPSAGAIIKGRADGDVEVLVFDAQHAHLFRRFDEQVTWDGNTVKINPGLARAFGVPHDAVGTKVPIREFVYCFVLRKIVPDGTIVVPLNYQNLDVRADNLVVVPGTSGKEFKPPKRVKPQVPIGMPFVPRGVSMNVDRGNAIKFIFGSKCGVAGTVCANRNNAVAQASTVVDKLRAADPTFDATHALYTSLLRSYDDALDECGAKRLD